MGSAAVRQQSPQIRVLNSDGSVAPLSNQSNVRVVQPEPKVRIVQSGTTGSPIKTTMTLSQAQQMGLIQQTQTSSGNVKILPKSPVKSEPRTVIVQSPQKQQIVIKGNASQNTARYIQPNQQVIRIPASAAAVGTVQKLQIGNKVQYVRVLPSESGKSSQKTILPSSAKSADAPNVVKVQLPGSQLKTTPRAILPLSGAQVRS